MKFTTWLRAEWDRVAGYTLVAGGAVLLIVGYLGVRNTVVTVDALSYVTSGGVGGLFCLGLGTALLLSADLHDEWRKLDRIEAALWGQQQPEARDTRAPAAAVLENRTPAAAPRGTAPARDERSRPPVTATIHSADGAVLTMLISTIGVLASVAVFAAGWFRARTTTDLDLAIEGLAFASMGLVLLGFSRGLHLLRLRSKFVARENQVLRDLPGSEIPGTASGLLDSGSPPVKLDTAPDWAWLAPGLHHFHRSGCPALDHRPDRERAPRSNLDPDLAPCGICKA